MRVGALRRGWRSHLSRFADVRRRLSGIQDPKVFCLSCSDSRVCVHEIFCLDDPGSIFEAKNVAGLFTEDAKSALTYALNHLHPDFIVILHHTRCGGYQSLSSTDTEPEIRKHMLSHSGLRAKMKVEVRLSKLKLKPQPDAVSQLIIEEGCRMQVNDVKNFLSVNYPENAKKIRSGEVKILALLYDIVSGKVYQVPESLEGSEDMQRQEF